MGQPLPDKLVDLLREMRSKGVSLAGLQEATGISKGALIRYTSDVPRVGLCACGRPADHGGGCAERRKSYNPSAFYRSIGDLTRKWNDAADDFLREWYPEGKTLEYLAGEVNEILGRDDITPAAVAVRVGKLKVLRKQVNNQGKSDGRKAYWRKWREERARNPG